MYLDCASTGTVVKVISMLLVEIKERGEYIRIPDELIAQGTVNRNFGAGRLQIKLDDDILRPFLMNILGPFGDIMGVQDTKFSVLINRFGDMSQDGLWVSNLHVSTGVDVKRARYIPNIHKARREIDADNKRREADNYNSDSSIDIDGMYRHKFFLSKDDLFRAVSAVSNYQPENRQSRIEREQV